MITKSDFKGKKVLVTGGAGFVGSNLTNALVELNAKVTVIDNLFTGKKENIKHFNKIRFVEGCITNQDLVNGLISKNEIIFHLAVVNIIKSEEDHRMSFDTNVLGTFNILEAMINYKKSNHRLIYSSSASVYGNAGHLPMCEDDLTHTITTYSAGKHSGENFCTAAFDKIPIIILRYTNVYGINQSPLNPYCGVVSKFFENTIKNKPLEIFGDGNQTRDFTFIDDVVEANLLAANCTTTGEVINIGTGIETSINTLAEAIAGPNQKYKYVEPRTIDNIQRRVLNTGKAQRVLGWKYKHPLKTGLEKTYKWLLSQQS